MNLSNIDLGILVLYVVAVISIGLLPVGLGSVSNAATGAMAQLFAGVG